MNTEQQLSFLSVATPWSTPALVKLAVGSVGMPSSIEQFLQDYVCAFWKGHGAHRAFLAACLPMPAWGERDFVRPNDWYKPYAVEVL